LGNGNRFCVQDYHSIFHGQNYCKRRAIRCAAGRGPLRTPRRCGGGLLTTTRQRAAGCPESSIAIASQVRPSRPCENT
jgi:hypothetical protein